LKICQRTVKNEKKELEKKSVGKVSGLNFWSKGEIVMPVWLTTAGKWGGLLTIIALVIALLRQIIEFVTFLMFAFKIGLVLAFLGIFALVGFMLLRTWQERRRQKQSL
jgi:hypothetical protein